MLTVDCRSGKDEVVDELSMKLPAVVGLSLFDELRYRFPSPPTVPPFTSIPAVANMLAVNDKPVLQTIFAPSAIIAYFISLSPLRPSFDTKSMNPSKHLHGVAGITECNLVTTHPLFINYFNLVDLIKNFFPSYLRLVS